MSEPSKSPAKLDRFGYPCVSGIDAPLDPTTLARGQADLASAASLASSNTVMRGLWAEATAAMSNSFDAELVFNGRPRQLQLYRLLVQRGRMRTRHICDAMNCTPAQLLRYEAGVNELLRAHGQRIDKSERGSRELIKTSAPKSTSR